MRISKILVCVAVVSCVVAIVFVCPSMGLNPDGGLEYCDRKVRRTLSEMRRADGTINYLLAPRNIPDSGRVWNYRPVCAEEWCSGFWSGVLWYDYEFTGDKALKAEAERFTRALGPLAYRPAYDHDLGFLLNTSYGNAYRLTGNNAYRRMLLAAADTLATLFNPAVGTLMSWPREAETFGGHNTIIDNMMNLELLFWAAHHGGNPYLYDVAVSHADMTMKNHFRPDFTAYHVVVYDSLSGRVIRRMTHQDYADGSMWACGQAWAIYGFTMVYRETKDERYLDFVRNVADVYLKRLPDDYVPYWDFDVPATSSTPRDASAACVAASALIELSTYVQGDDARRYRDAAVKMLESLGSKHYRCGSDKAAFLMHATCNQPAGLEVDASIIYADYYYIAALTRLKKLYEGRAVV